MKLDEAKEKLLEHGFGDFENSSAEFVANVANYVSNNYKLEEKIPENSNNKGNSAVLSRLISSIGGASEELLNNVKSGKYDPDDVLIFFANHLDSSMLFALEGYEDPELPLNEIVAFEDLENLYNDQILPVLFDKIKRASLADGTTLLFNHKLNENEWKTVSRHLKEINVDHCRRLLMLLLRLDVTVMSFFGSARLEHLEDKIRELHKEGKTDLVIPKSAGISDLLAVDTSLLNIERVKQNARTRITKYTLEEAPPTRGGTQRLQLSSGAADPSSASRGRNFYRGRGGGGGHRGRGNFRQQYSKREGGNLQNQIYTEIDRQRAEAEAPNRKRAKS